jgi:hypothetical protein
METAFTIDRNRRVAALSAAAAVLAAAIGWAGLLAGQEPASGGPTPHRPHRRGLVVFVVDASASMRIRDVERGGRLLSRIEAAGREIADTLEGLVGEGDFLFDVVVFSTRIETLSESLDRSGPLVLDGAAKDEAIRFLLGRRGAGMSRLQDAVARGVEICRRADARWKPGTVLLYSDGIPTGVRRVETGRGPGNTPLEGLEWSDGDARVNAFALSATTEGIEFLTTLCSATGGVVFLH